MKKLLTYIIVFVIVGTGIISCNTDIEALDIVVPDKMSKEYWENLGEKLFKENYYYNFKTGIVSTNIKDADYVINNALEFDNLSTLLLLNTNVSIKIRVLLQYYGTNVIRNHFWHNAFVHYTINKAFDIRNKLGQCIIADARFDNECNVIKVCGGKIIRVDRRVNNDNHESEQIKICDDDYVIDNTGTLVGLFYKVLKFVTDYMV